VKIVKINLAQPDLILDAGKLP